MKKVTGCKQHSNLQHLETARAQFCDFVVSRFYQKIKKNNIHISIFDNKKIPSSLGLNIKYGDQYGIRTRECRRERAVC